MKKPAFKYGDGFGGASWTMPCVDENGQNVLDRLEKMGFKVVQRPLSLRPWTSKDKLRHVYNLYQTCEVIPPKGWTSYYEGTRLHPQKHPSNNSAWNKCEWIGEVILDEKGKPKILVQQVESPNDHTRTGKFYDKDVWHIVFY